MIIVQMLVFTIHNTMCAEAQTSPESNCYAMEGECILIMLLNIYFSRHGEDSCIEVEML